MKLYTILKKILGKFLVLGPFMGLSIGTLAQPPQAVQPPALFEQPLFAPLKLRCIGPAGMGRINSIAVYEKNPNIIYLGIACSGVWRTLNGGTTWVPVFDEGPTQNIGAVAVQPTNPAVVWAGTGDGKPRNSKGLGEGIFKSVDSGRTWTCMGLEKTINIEKIVIDPVHPQTVYVAAIGNAFSDHQERGVYKTTDGGKTWKQVLYTNAQSGCAELVMNPKNPNQLYAAMWQHRRTPWSIYSGGEGSGLYTTRNGGKTWQKLTVKNGMPEGELGRIGIALSAANPKVVYALVEAKKAGLYKSKDGGTTWRLVYDNEKATRELQLISRPFYFQKIYCDPQNENKIFSLNEQVRVSYDGGKTFQEMLLYLHADHHAFWVSPVDSNFMMNGNDGEFAWTHDGGKNWQKAKDLTVGQVYKVSVDTKTPYHVMGGMQDNGNWFGPAYLSSYSGKIYPQFWTRLTGGDGMTSLRDRANEDNFFCLMQSGNFIKINRKTSAENGAGDGYRQDKDRFNWNTPLVLDPFDKNGLYSGNQYLLHSRDGAISWERISPDLTTNDSSKLMVYQTTLFKTYNIEAGDISKYESLPRNGGLTKDLSGAEVYSTIISIAPSYLNRNLIWVGTDDGNVQLTRDGGKTWTNFRNRIPGLPRGSWIAQINASRYQEGEAFVVANNYRQGDRSAYIFHTKDWGQTWERLVDDSKVKGYALSIQQDPIEPNLLFVGTECGLWISLDRGSHFCPWKNGFPSVAVTDITVQEEEGDLVLATFGRSFWILDDLTPLRELAGGLDLKADSLHLFQPPLARQYPRSLSVQNAFDENFKALHAENRPLGVPISFYCPPELMKVNGDTVKVWVYQGVGVTGDPEKFAVTPGFNRYYAKTYDFQNMQPGLYKALFQWGTVQREIQFTIKEKGDASKE